ncbi:DUF4362 domain-containing protein [Lysinibacillus xylanilyticus]|uniref:DUF4362 domain-containing protein n=1 Tax=Lysinibacillus xylanilyticus TaxID=582475 RepID=A0A2M9Q478_9BACI|nr:DUF4362 domain-containing protein [Lysinibacillus xylanilyticus]PJO42869.1 hypothetical protein CWD94_13845 [Lysinibacillus xylanilyticus]
MRFVNVGLLLLLTIGCQSNNIEKVINDHGDIQNLESLDRFVENIKNQNKAEINYVQYGIEGQRGVSTLVFDGEQINISHSVDGNFIEEYSCKKIIVETEEGINKYILNKCNGNLNENVEFLSVPISN